MDNIVKNQLEKELDRNVTQQSKISDAIDIIKGVQNNLESIAEQPERPHSFFQVNSLAYVPATIIHTGEQYVAVGSAGQILMTTQETLSFLQRKINSLNTSLDLFKQENLQLQNRKEIYFNESESYNISEEATNMPAEIASDFGTAYKVGTGVFEIIEPYREDEERKPIKSSKRSEEPIKQNDWYMRRLEELEQEENDTDDKITPVKVETTNEDEIVGKKVKMIIKRCGLYKSLLKDDDIKRFCDQAGGESTSNDESILNSIIIKTLLSESTSVLRYSEDDLAKDFEENLNVSKNDLRASEFLDSIENDL